MPELIVSVHSHDNSTTSSQTAEQSGVVPALPGNCAGGGSLHQPPPVQPSAEFGEDELLKPGDEDLRPAETELRGEHLELVGKLQPSPARPDPRHQLRWGAHLLGLSNAAARPEVGVLIRRRGGSNRAGLRGLHA
eukprot:CAMPEP_0168622912 /NCGR_PEP_ID=MMETSP0449_2-20121227/8535_1 /TAXON_ID=1082188 /ORGANISM="Strombidium rassoulzadegani, Strain ras09" /LENGTH=134 /DNA_ID=CAMNT_0008664239 /DNA_START=547 /DNA_END=950 /DNA_ORIENTATION=-